MKKQQGTVKFYNGNKGYGFITPDSGDKDIFVHVTALKESGMSALTEGQRVEYDTEPSRDPGKGPKAVDIAAL